MQQSQRAHWWWLILGLMPGFVIGCAEGPLGLAPLNPYLRQKWAEDEKYGPTYHRRISELRDLRATARRLDANKKEQLVSEMARMVQEEPNALLRSEAVAVLGELGTVSSLPALSAALGDAEKEVRIAACHAWGRINSGDSLTTLSQVAEREADVDVRLAALEELGKFKEPTAVQSLGKALDDNDPAVQHRAVQSLKSSTERDFGDSVPAWRDYVQGREPSPSSGSFVQRMFNWF